MNLSIIKDVIWIIEVFAEEEDDDKVVTAGKQYVCCLESVKSIEWCIGGNGQTDE